MAFNWCLEFFSLFMYQMGTAHIEYWTVQRKQFWIFIPELVGPWYSKSKCWVQKDRNGWIVDNNTISTLADDTFTLVSLEPLVNNNNKNNYVAVDSDIANNNTYISD